MNLWMAQDGRLRAGWRALAGCTVAYLANRLAIVLAVTAPVNRPRLFEAIYRPSAMLLVMAGFSLLLIVLDGVEGNPLPAMGLDAGLCRLRQALGGVMLGGVLIGAVMPGLVAWGQLSFRLHLTSHSLALAGGELYILATGAMAEELVFRGYPLQRLMEGMGPALGVALMSLLFGAVHLANPNASALGFANTVGVGVVLSLAYVRTRSLWLPWGIHFGWNTTLGMVFGLPVSGLTDFAVLVRGTARGPQWITGGPYGIEAGVLGSGAIVLGLVGVILGTRKPKRNSSHRAPPDPTSLPADAVADRAAPGGMQP